MKRSLFVFGVLSDADVDWLASIARRVDAKDGDILIEEGVVSEKFLILIDGSADVSVGGRRVASVSSGDILGEIALFDSRPPSATVTARGPLTALAIDFETLRARVSADPEFASRLYLSLGRLMAQRMRETMGGMIEDADEIDPDVLETVALASHRFARVRDIALAKR